MKIYVLFLLAAESAAFAPSTLTRRCATPLQCSHAPRTAPSLVALPATARRRGGLRLRRVIGGKPFGMGQLFGYLWPSRGAHIAKLRISCALALLLAAKLFIVRVPFIFKVCIDSLTTSAASTTIAWMVAYGLARALYTLLQEARYLLFTPVGQNALRRFMRDAFEHVQSLDAGWLSQQSTGELSRVFARGVRGMNALLRLLVFNVVPTALEALLVVGLLGRRYGANFLLASLVCVSVFVAWSIYVVERRVALLQQLNDNDNRIFTKFFNSLLNNEAVRSFTNEEHEVEQYDSILGDLETLSVKDVQTLSLLNAGQALIFSLGLGTVLALCVGQVLGGTLSIGDVVAIHGMLLQLQQPLTSLGFSYQEIRSSLTDMKQLLLLLRRTPQVASAADAPDLEVHEGAVEFHNVSFSYSATSTAGALKGVSFRIPPNKKTAIVGSSGSGKSTVLKLILRAYDPSDGCVTIDGQDVRKVGLPSLREQLGLVPQDTILFDETMAYNLRYGDLHASEEEALAAARAVGLDETASKMPDGYYTRVGERGLTLSGGERQRVAIARALLKDPPLMLYDEPTSALDAITEESIDKVLHESETNRTSIVVAHKLKLIQDADLILVMENGTLAEQGTHANLLCQPNSTYSRLWAQQQYSDANYFEDRGPPAWCERPMPGSANEEARRFLEGSAIEALGSDSSSGGWLW